MQYACKNLLLCQIHTQKPDPILNVLLSTWVRNQPCSSHVLWQTPQGIPRPWQSRNLSQDT